MDSLRIANFTREEVAALYGQHTADTGQPFTPEAIDRAYDYTRGQPWLVNALGREITSKPKMAVLPPVPVTAAHVDEAKERVIKDRLPHLDSLAARVREPRVQRVIEPILAGDDVLAVDATYSDGLAYVRDLGLIADSSRVRIANPMYRDVIVRILSSSIQSSIRTEPRAFLLPDGRHDMDKLMSSSTAAPPKPAPTAPPRSAPPPPRTAARSPCYVPDLVIHTARLSDVLTSKTPNGVRSLSGEQQGNEMGSTSGIVKTSLMLAVLISSQTGRGERPEISRRTHCRPRPPPR